MSALENSCVVFQLYPYHENFSKRIVKPPKLYFYDTGLLCFLLKINNADQLLTHPVKGSLFENMMIAEYVKRMHHKNKVRDVWFWRDSEGHEVDMIIQEEGQKLNLIEFKATQTIMPDMFKGIAYFEKLSDRELDKTLVYGGSDNQERSYGKVLSWKDAAG